MRPAPVFGLFLAAAAASPFLGPAGGKPAPDDADRALLAAVRNGDRSAVRDWLDGGADVDARDEGGATALMQAALNSDAEMMDLLLERGADVNARNKAGATALLWALHDPDKVKRLVARGADVDLEVGRSGTTAVILAAGVSGSRDTLERLLDKGAPLKASKSGFTPLMAAALAGDREAVQFLIDRGADVKATTAVGFTALNGAALARDADLVGLLLDNGADPNAKVEVSQPADDVGAPAITAASRGDAASLKRLLDKGADANVQGGDFARSALLVAATTGSAETVRLLLAKGAEVNAADSAGNTPLQWARRRGGDDPTARLLEKAGGKDPSRPPKTEEPRRLQQTLDADSPRRAAAKSLPLLQQSARAFREGKGCVSCHHQSLTAMAVGLARKRGLAVDEDAAAKERAQVRGVLEKNIDLLLQGSGVTDPPVPAWTLVALAAEEQEPSRTTDALVQYLVLKQRKDGSWRTPVNRPPLDASDITFTALAVRGLRLYAPKGRAKEVEGRVARARGWLLAAEAAETEDKALRLLGLRWADADRREVRAAADALLHEQREDGGWAQLPTLSSDAYATGEVLFALNRGADVAVDDPAYRRGVEFLLKTQLADGSWFVPTRSFPFQPYFSTGFPHGRSQFISAAATSWATIALSLTVPIRKE
jgi:ankyrin repeat protein